MAINPADFDLSNILFTISINAFIFCLSSIISTLIGKSDDKANNFVECTIVFAPNDITPLKTVAPFSPAFFAAYTIASYKGRIRSVRTEASSCPRSNSRTQRSSRTSAHWPALRGLLDTAPAGQCPTPSHARNDNSSTSITNSNATQNRCCT